jgi:hypothetical protein
MKVGGSVMSNLRRLAGDKQKSNRNSFVAARLRMTNWWEYTKHFKCDSPELCMGNDTTFRVCGVQS